MLIILIVFPLNNDKLATCFKFHIIGSQITVTQSGPKSMTCSHGRNILISHSSKSQKCFSVIQVNRSHGWNQFRNIFIKLQWVKWRREKKRSIFKTKKISRGDLSLARNPQYTKNSTTVATWMGKQKYVLFTWCLKFQRGGNNDHK